MGGANAPLAELRSSGNPCSIILATPLDALGYDKRNKRTARQLELQEEVVATKRRRVEEEEKTWDSAASKCSRNIAYDTFQS